jgi:hypothetical protein
MNLARPYVKIYVDKGFGGSKSLGKIGELKDWANATVFGHGNLLRSKFVSCVLFIVLSSNYKSVTG